jgi:hypothetical protein
MKTLIQSNIGWSRKPVAKPDIAELKRTILRQYEEKKQCFEASIVASTSPNRCPVCKRSDSRYGVLVYPCLCYRSSLPSFIQRLQDDDPDRELTVVGQAFCCSHKVHLECITDSEDTRLFQCPSCDRRRNTFLPAFSADLREFESHAVLRVAQHLGDCLSLTSSEVEVLAFQIVTLEARAALKPEILDLEDLRQTHF